jgi:hypothetical protein
VITDAEIVQRTVLALVNEGARALSPASPHGRRTST